jgi:hypothetical protein
MILFNMLFEVNRHQEQGHKKTYNDWFLTIGHQGLKMLILGWMCNLLLHIT